MTVPGSGRLAPSEGVELQINVAPTDFPHARRTLLHQLRCLGPQVDSIQLTFDCVRGHGHYATKWKERTPAMRALLDELRLRDSRVRIIEVDYSTASLAAVSAKYFGGVRVPRKDRLGAPFHAYFYGLMHSSRRYVFHMDSDMLYGGCGSSWVAEAVALISARADVLACNPLAGPPTAGGELRSQWLEQDSVPPVSFRTRSLSTRLFLIDTVRLAAITPIPLVRPSWLRRALCRIEGCSPVEAAETCLSAAMERAGLWRVDFLGTGVGLWAVHPPYRSRRFYAGLPGLIARIEANDVPDEQRGRHDVHDSLIDWSDVRPTRLRRLGRHLALVGSRLTRQIPIRARSAKDG